MEAALNTRLKMDINFMGASDLVSFVHLGWRQSGGSDGTEPAASGVTGQIKMRNSLHFQALKVHNNS